MTPDEIAHDIVATWHGFPQAMEEAIAAAIAAERVRAEKAEAEAAMLRDPAALHINLLRGNYLTRAQLLHLGGEAAQIAVAEAVARAEKVEADLKAAQLEFAEFCKAHAVVREALQKAEAALARVSAERDETERLLEAFKQDALVAAREAALREVARLLEREREPSLAAHVLALIDKEPATNG